MEFEPEWLLVLPLFFALGWLSAQWDSRRRAREVKQLPKSYFKGLHHLLDQEPDKAIDALIDVARVDTGTVDLYFALGHLFTQRGEVERSIRVYQSLIDRPDLSDAARQAAMHKLGMAFLSGGLFDRAEQCFQSLLNSDYAGQAREQLLHIYQSQQEWAQAIEMAQSINRAPATAGTQTTALAHFHCELANEAIHRQDWTLAQKEIDAALSEQAHSIRAQILRGRLYAAQNQHEAALLVWKNLATEQPDAAPLMVHEVVKSAVATGRTDEGIERLYENVLDTGSIDVLNAWLAMQKEYGDPTQTVGRLSDIFARHPSLNALNQLLNERIKTQPESDGKHSEGELIRGLIQKQVKQLSRYRCTHCGFEAHQYYWQCPACTHWETYPPKRLEELQQVKRSRSDANSYY